MSLCLPCSIILVFTLGTFCNLWHSWLFVSQSRVLIFICNIYAAKLRYSIYSILGGVGQPRLNCYSDHILTILTNGAHAKREINVMKFIAENVFLIQTHFIGTFIFFVLLHLFLFCFPHPVFQIGLITVQFVMIPTQTHSYDDLIACSTVSIWESSLFNVYGQAMGPQSNLVICVHH